MARISLQSSARKSTTAKKTTTAKRKGPGDPPPFSMKVKEPDFSPKAKRPVNYNYVDAQKRSKTGNVNKEMSDLRNKYRVERNKSAKAEAQGKPATFTRQQFRDSVATTMRPGQNADSEVKRLVGSPRKERKIAIAKDKAYNGKAAHKAATKKKKMVGSPGPGVNLCKSKSAF